MFKSAEDILDRKFTGKFATIQTEDNKEHKGHIYVVDPQSKTVVLSSNGDTGTNLTMITSHSIRSIDIDDQNDKGEFNLFDNQGCIFRKNIEELRTRKNKLKDWLGLHHLEVVEDEEEVLRFQEHLIIEPPYDLEHCYCTNTIILDRFKSIIEKMPQ